MRPSECTGLLPVGPEREGGMGGAAIAGADRSRQEKVEHRHEKEGRQHENDAEEELGDPIHPVAPAATIRLMSRSSS